MGVGQQPVALAPGGFIASAIPRMRRLQRGHQPVEKIPASARTFGEQPIHRGSQPQYRQPFRQLVGGHDGLVDPGFASLGCFHTGSASDVNIPEMRCHGKIAGPILIRDIAECGAA